MGRKSRKRRPPTPNARRELKKLSRVESEPQTDDEEWGEWGGELIWAAGFTEGGAPYGLTVDEFREGNAREGEARGADWVRAKRLLHDLFARRAGGTAKAEIGWVKFFGDGLCRKAFVAEVSLHPDPEELSDAYVVLLPRPDAERSFDERARSEARLLTRLAALDLPLRIPKVLGLLSDGGRPAIIETAVRGVPLDLRAGRQPSLRPWEVVAQIAATVHTLNAESLALPEDSDWKMPGFGTRRDHALTSLSIFEGRPEPLLRDIHAWALENLPPAAPSVLLHGDLLGQNILIAPGEPLGLIDWEWAELGDPAYDLAIVTRGARRPFQTPGGLDRLLEAYAVRSSEIKRGHVHLYELCMIARWYVESLPGRERGHPPEEYLNRLAGVFRRAGAEPRGTGL
jgi:aminoglycoside phosphotransferase (APT) family kinase protein